MLERKLYKTKLCILYQRGHCPRQSCSFAHGDAELRRFSGSFSSGRRDYRASDLRDKLERRHSPHRRYSPGRDTRSRRAFHGQKPVPYDRGYSPSRSPSKRSERRHRKKQHLDGQSDVSGSLKISDDAEDQIKDGKRSSYDDKDVLEEQLKQAQLDVDMLDDHKCQLEMIVEEKAQEAETLTTRIEELETQLNKEQEDCKRITSKIKKFIKAHNRYSRAQEELKRTQARLQRLGDQLGSDTARAGANEEGSSVNIVSDGEANEDNRMTMSPRNEVQNHASPSKKRLRGDLGVGEESKQVLSRRREGLLSGKIKLEKLTQWQGPAQVENNSKEAELLNKIPTGNNVRRPLANAIKHKRGKNDSPSTASLDKVFSMHFFFPVYHQFNASFMGKSGQSIPFVFRVTDNLNEETDEGRAENAQYKEVRRTTSLVRLSLANQAELESIKTCLRLINDPSELSGIIIVGNSESAIAWVSR